MKSLSSVLALCLLKGYYELKNRKENKEPLNTGSYANLINDQFAPVS